MASPRWRRASRQVPGPGSLTADGLVSARAGGAPAGFLAAAAGYLRSPGRAPPRLAGGSAGTRRPASGEGAACSSPHSHPAPGHCGRAGGIDRPRAALGSCRGFRGGVAAGVHAAMSRLDEVTRAAFQPGVWPSAARRGRLPLGRGLGEQRRHRRRGQLQPGPLGQQPPQLGRRSTPSRWAAAIRSRHLTSIVFLRGLSRVPDAAARVKRPRRTSPTARPVPHRGAGVASDPVPAR